MSGATLTPADREDLHRKMDVEIAKLIGESSKLGEETAELSAETAKLNAELCSYPWLPLATTIMGSTALIGAIATILIALNK